MRPVAVVDRRQPRHPMGRKEATGHLVQHLAPPFDHGRFFSHGRSLPTRYSEPVAQIKSSSEAWSSASSIARIGSGSTSVSFSTPELSIAFNTVPGETDWSRP